jgi:hypothetical protein
LREIQRSLEDAINDSAHAPVASLHRLEVDVIELLRAAEAREAAERATAATEAMLTREPEAVFEAVLETARELPPDLRDRLLAALAHEPSLRVVAG